MPGIDPGAVSAMGDRIVEALLYYRMPIVASGMIGLALGVLGTFVVLRRMALIGDALSHSILPGVVVAFLVLEAAFGGFEGLLGVWGLFLGALLAGLVTAVGIGWVSRNARAKEDTAIGIVFTAMFGLGVVLISLQPKGTHFDLTCFLFGLPLAIQTQDFVSIAIITPLVLAYVTLGYRGLKILSFDPQMAQALGVRVGVLHYVFMGFLAATVVAALRTVGVIMSVAMLVTPAATAYQLTNRLSVMLLLSGLFGALSAVAGFLVAFALNIPTGPAMVLFATLLFGGAMLLSPKYGILERALRRRRIRGHIREEDVLKALARAERPLSIAALADAVPDQPRAEVQRSVNRLLRQNLLVAENGTVRPSEEGLRRGREMVRAHRLWESYLAGQDVPVERVHEVAERLEHAHEYADELDVHLGHPCQDPHGEEIPRNRNTRKPSGG